VVLNLIPVDVGTPTAAGASFAYNATDIDVIAGGVDIWGTSDSGHLLIGPRSGNFDIKTRVAGLTRVDAITKAGLMVRESFDADSPNLYLNVSPPNGRNTYELGQRTNAAGASGSWSSSGVNLAAAGVPNAWMRLQRFGNTIYGFRSTNGLDWTLLGQAVVNYTNYLVGLRPRRTSLPGRRRRWRSSATTARSLTPTRRSPSRNSRRTPSRASTASQHLRWRRRHRTRRPVNCVINGRRKLRPTTGRTFPTPIALRTSLIPPAALSGRRYRAVVSVPGASATSSAATLTVGADTTRPLVTAVRGNRSLNRIQITFSERVSSSTATFAVTNSSGTQLIISNATLSADQRSVTLATAPQAPGGIYTVRITGVADLATNVITTTNVTARAWVYTRGFVQKELYLGLSTSTVALSDLRGSPNYPDAPDIVRYGDTAALNTRMSLKAMARGSVAPSFPR
jgi:methionine-rich copper-binding protein CopC